MDANITKDIFEQVFKGHSKNIEVFLRGSKAKGDNYDKFRDTGYVKSNQNPFFIKAMIKTISANSLIIRDMGLTETGALQIIVKDSDVDFIRLSKKILIKSNEYYVFNDSVGSKLQIFEVAFGYSKIIIFRKQI